MEHNREMIILDQLQKRLIEEPEGNLILDREIQELEQELMESVGNHFNHYKKLEKLFAGIGDLPTGVIN